MIAVLVESVIYPNDDNSYQINKVCYINPALVCAIKPSIFALEREDILTADGMIYRVVTGDNGVQRIKGYDGVARDYRVVEVMSATSDIRFANESEPTDDIGA